MKIRTRTLSIAIIVLTILVLFFAFEYINNLVSYKYEVQDFQQKGKDPLYGLNEHQIGIIDAITFCKTTSISCLSLLIITLIVRVAEPTFKGRVFYVRKAGTSFI
ncbi:hypothetical protein [Mucilaginibacter sp. SP1R1]|uniref:hypothetical protein n=1 Tax=Mucilaginibacter sp. SP1R1 TaxID=2723091 RepID=UPI0016188DDB|nr:hypothetical protein [Mucilaginibacter sp. SP1R1]MBB6150409.1 hypothetical protein [Mucilaginibacter sp. SP1R1]